MGLGRCSKLRRYLVVCASVEQLVVAKQGFNQPTPNLSIGRATEHQFSPRRARQSAGKRDRFSLFNVNARAIEPIETLRRPEGTTLESKQYLSSPTGFKRTVVAFANTAGGTNLIGVEDQTGYVRGVAEPLAPEERVASLINDSVSPRVLRDIEFLSYRDTQVLAVQIHPSSTRPHFLASAGLDSGTYVRVGSTNRRADAELIAAMQRFSRGEGYDEQPIPNPDSEAVNFRVASELFAEARKLSPRDLQTLWLVTTYQGR